MAHELGHFTASANLQLLTSAAASHGIDWCSGTWISPNTAKSLQTLVTSTTSPKPLMTKLLFSIDELNELQALFEEYPILQKIFAVLIDVAVDIKPSEDE